MLPARAEVVANAAPAGGGLRVGHLLAVFRRRWWVVLLLIALAVGAALAYLERQPPPGYTSRARMWVRGKMRVNNVAEYVEPGDFFGTQIALMQSDPMRARAMERLKRLDPDFVIPRGPDGRPVKPFVRVSQVKGAAMFLLECTSHDKAFSQQFLDALMDEFLEYKNEVRAATAGDLLTSVSDQVYKQERALKHEQERLSEFQREHNLTLIEEQVRGGATQLAELNSQLAMLELELKLLDAAALEKSVGLAGASGPVAGAPAPGSSLAGEISSARQTLAQLRMQREEMGRYLRPKHPKMVRLNDEIARAERVIEMLREENLDSAATAKQAMRIRLESLRSTVAALQERVASANRLYAEYQGIQAAIERQRELYTQLIGLLRSIDLNRNIEQEAVAILERAGPAQSSERPAALILVAAAVMGGFAGLALIFLLSRLDDRCDSVEDVRAEFAEEIFGQIPEVRIKDRRRTHAILDRNTDDQVFAESCRSLRSNLLFGQPGGERPRTVAVTSAVPDEGKTTIALNLAQALSLGGARVLLVDADLRRGHIHETLKVSSDRGLSDLLRESGNVADYTMALEDSNLDFLPRGSLIPNPGELMLSRAFDVFVAQARELYDHVIIDTVPVFAADDAASVASRVDSVLFVVRRGYTSSRLAQEALDLLYQRRANVMGIVFNRVNSRSRGYRYYRYEQYHTTTA